MTTRTSGRGPGLALWLPVVAAALLAGFVAAHVSNDIPFDSDEANHANIALRQFQDLRDGRLADFVRHSYRTGQFPFLHGWTLLPWFAVFGTTAFAARAAQCLAFFVGVAATGWAAWRASGDDRRAAAIGAGLFAISPYLATFAGLCMLETPGAAATALTLAAFAEACRAEGRRATVLHAATAVAALATYFIKLNYGLWIIPAIGAGYAVRWLRAPSRREAARGALVYAAVVVVALAVWYATAAQRAAFMGFLHNPSQAISIEHDAPTVPVAGFSPSIFVSYVPLVASEYHTHWLIGALVLVAFASGALGSLRNPVIAASVACVAWTWFVLSMGVREYAMARFIASALPALWIVAAVGVASLLRRADDAHWIPIAGATAQGLGLAAQGARLPDLLAAEYEVGTEFVPVFDFVAESIPPKSSVLVVGYTDHTSARTLQWRLGARPGNAWRDFDVVGLNSERIFESSSRLDTWMTKPRPWGDTDWTSYIVEVLPGPDYRDRDLVIPETAKLWRDAVARHEPHLTRVTARRFAEIGAEVVVWRDRTPPKHLGLHGGE